ncbi:PDZ domain-containing protein 8 isoform X2 [Zeugodacus cucurbitae]|uniref:PDZ domain-containing protein 8 isoform X2 n=1 Tax=Zeugodacus cucurbitae TaxID=28588 RepID=UPI0010A74D83|nr:PDZ domain-containing protein 8 isoform X2 [Zeugodacus cucurbitae]
MDIPLSMLLLLSLVFTVIGAVLVLLLQYYLYLRFSVLPEESAEQKDINTKYSLPTQTAHAINLSPPTSSVAGHTHTVGATEAAPLMSINFVMQFLFHELKNSSRVRKWFYRKLSLELDELLAKTTTGKLFDKLTIKELELGDQFPEIRTLRVHSIELNDTGDRIENLDILLEIHYTGNFRTSIDADMVLGKKGSLTLIVKQLSGLARLQFTREPYTHWSLSFLGDPELDLAIESKYQGRQMQSNITSLISNQIRKAVRRKHTLPNYKLRYKPFFHKTPEEDADGDIQPNGTLEVRMSEISRLMCPEVVTEVYCTLTLASLAFVEIRQKDNRNVIVLIDVEIHKAKNQQIGILFKQITEQGVEVEAVLPNTPACKSDLRPGDILIAVEGKRVQSIQQVAKLFKSLQTSAYRLRIERVIPGIIRNDAILEDLELYEDLGDAHMGYGLGKASTESNEFGGKQVPARQNTGEKGSSSESSLGNTPTNSPKKSKLITKALKKTISRELSEHNKDKEDDNKLKSKQTLKAEEKMKGSPKVLIDTVGQVEHYYQHSTVDRSINRLIHMDDLSSFKLDVKSRYLNVGVYSKSTGDGLLLGFVNIPVGQILAECCETSLVQCWKKYELSPPIPQDLKTHKLCSQSGFIPDLCFGDVLFAFTWDGNPNLQPSESLIKQVSKSKSKINLADEKMDNDSGVFDTNSLRTTPSSSSLTSTNQITSSQLRSHSFVRTHFQRATQCDFCGKKIWLKDAVQCSECAMCCHKKCITKCQNATVCGPVDCSNVLRQRQPSITSTTPEFTVTDADACDASEGEEAMPSLSGEESAETVATKTPPTPVLEVHRSSLTGLLAQGIKRVNSANNLAIPGIVSSLAGSGGGASNLAAKSLPPSPQRSPSRKSSLVCSSFTTFDSVTRRLEAIPSDVTALSIDQISSISEPIIAVLKDEDVMTLAKNASKNLYNEMPAAERIEQINSLLSKLRLALDSETALYSSLASGDTSKMDNIDTSSTTLGKSEDRVQALSVIMLYLCTGLQHAQGFELR